MQKPPSLQPPELGDNPLPAVDSSIDLARKVVLLFIVHFLSVSLRASLNLELLPLFQLTA